MIKTGITKNKGNYRPSLSDLLNLIKVDATESADGKVGNTGQSRCIGPLYKNSVLIDVSWRNRVLSDSLKLDLSSYENYKIVKGKLDTIGSSKIETHLLFETLRDPRPVLKALRDWLIADSRREINNIKHLGKYKKNVNSDLKKLLLKSGFRVEDRTKYFIITCSNKFYDDFLASQNMPTRDFKHLLVSTEHSDYRKTGGIGSYIKECDRLYAKEATVLIIDTNQTLDEDYIKAKRWLSIQSLIGFDYCQKLTEQDSGFMYGIALMHAIINACFYYDIDSMEYFEGAAHRIIQARKAGMLPSDVMIVTVCHGSTFHLAKCANTLMDKIHSGSALREKYSIERSDLAIFPTQYLIDSYSEIGVSPERYVIRRLPIELSNNNDKTNLESYENFIYVGKISKVKGFDIFLKTVILIAQKTDNRPKNIHCFVTSTEIHDDEIKELLLQAKRLYDIKIESLNRNDLMQELNKLKNSSIALITYPGDNHPLAVLEIINMGVDIIVIDAGGTPELLGLNTREYYVGPTNEQNLSDFVIGQLNEIETRSKMIQGLKSWYQEEQLNINEKYKVSFFKEFKAVSPIVRPSVIRENDHYSIRDTHIVINLLNKDIDSYLSEIKARVAELNSINGVKTYTFNDKLSEKLGLKRVGALNQIANIGDNIIIADREVPYPDFVYRLKGCSDEYLLKHNLTTFSHPLADEAIGDEVGTLLNNYNPIGEFDSTNMQYDRSIGGGSIGFRVLDPNSLDKTIDLFISSNTCFYIDKIVNDEKVVLIPEELSISMPVYFKDMKYVNEFQFIKKYKASQFDKYLILCDKHFTEYSSDINRGMEDALQATFNTYDTQHIAALVKVSDIIKYIPHSIKGPILLGLNITHKIVSKIHRRALNYNGKN